MSGTSDAHDARAASYVVDRARIDRNWRAITADLDTPRPSRLERSLRSVGVPLRFTRVVVATPALRRAWFLSIGIAVLVGLGAVDPDDPVQSLFTLLVVAPLVPVLGVALAYGPSADPAYEIELATPMRGIRLVAIRSATVLVTAMVCITSAALLSDVARPMAAAWLLPSIALTTASLALMTVQPPRRATTIVGCTWVAVAFTARVAFDDSLAAFGPVGQAVSLAISLAMAGAVTVRREQFDRLQGAT